MLQITYTQIGDNELSPQFAEHGRTMAERLRLIGREKVQSQPAPQRSPEWQRAASHTAWAMFSWSSIWTIYYHQSAPYQPPNFPIPGDQTHDPNGWLLHPLPTYMGDTFTLLCKFWLIAHETIEAYYSELGVPIVDRISLKFAESQYQRLLKWSTMLPASVARGSPETHHVALLQ